MGIEATAFDNHLQNNVIRQPLLVEIKELRNLSQPFQRSLISEEDNEKKKGKGKKHTYQLKVHDGKRFFKVVLLFDKQYDVVKNLHEVNKFFLFNA